MPVVTQMGLVLEKEKCETAVALLWKRSKFDSGKSGSTFAYSRPIPVISKLLQFLLPFTIIFTRYKSEPLNLLYA